MFIDMENLQENKFLQIATNLDRAFVEKFREYCSQNDFKQKTLIRRLLEWWLALDPISQEHIYRGRMNEVFAFEDEAAAARDTAKKQRRKVRPHPSKAG